MRRRKSIKPWKKWLLGIAGCILGLLLITAIVLYYQIKSIQVEDILQRHQALASAPQKSVKDGTQVAPAPTNEPTVPTLLTAPIGKANEFASKPIKTQDALDVAAILMKSGLSLKEVYYLTGQAKSDLTNEEKQKIRDLLLAKLTKDEIEALRSITTQYGKGLLILDPNYPIELIGIEDPEERKRVEKELQEKKRQPEKPQAQQPVQIVPTPTPTPKESESPPKESPKSASDPNLIATYTSKLESLKASCQGNINTLVSGVINAKKENKNLGISELQGMFMQKFVDAESKCDASFNTILTDAGKAGISSSEIEAWRSSYYSMKQEAQGNAIAQIGKAFSNK